MKIKRNYNIFTKQELVDFLSKYEDNFLYLDKPFDIMIKHKMDAVMEAIDNVNHEHEKLNCSPITTDEKLAYMLQIHEINARWMKLNNEYERLTKLRFGD